MARIMSSKIVVAAAIFLLAIQQGSIASLAASNPVDDLDSLKRNAVELISKTHKKFLDNAGELTEYVRDAYHWVRGNDSLNQQVKETADFSIVTVEILAEELVQRGKTDGKPEEYFSCVEEQRKNATNKIEEELLNYLLFVELLKERATNDIERYLTSMEKLSSAVESLYAAYIKHIYSCEDESCVSNTLAEAKDVYMRAEINFTSFWNRSIGVFYKFRTMTREAVTKAEQTISETMENSRQNMKQC